MYKAAGLLSKKTHIFSRGGMKRFTFFRLLVCCGSVLGLLSCIHVREAVYLDMYRGEPIPFEEMIDPETGKTAVRFVDVNSEAYGVARSYMVRLNKQDLEEGPLLERMAKIAQMKKHEFADYFQYLIPS